MKNPPRMRDCKPPFLQAFLDHAGFRRVAIEFSGDDFRQHFAIAMLESRPTKLADQDDFISLFVDRKDAGAITDVIRLPHLILPDAVAPAILESRAAQRVMMIG